MLIGYVCNRAPYLRIGKDIHFEGGVFETEDEGLQELIQSNDSFGTWIQFREDPEILAKRAAEAEAAKMQGGFKSEESQDATLRYADRIGMAPEDAQVLVEEKKEEVSEIRQEKLEPRRKRGRPRRKPIEDSWRE